MTIDVIMLAKGDKGQLKSMTQQAINSIHASEKDIQFEIVVVESVPGVTYKHCKVVYPMQDRFNYNTATLFGLEHIRPEAEYVLFVNNDIKAHKGFTQGLVDGLMIYDSVSPANPMMPQHRGLRGDYVQGFGIWHGDAPFCGWAFMMKYQTVYENLNRFFPDEIEGWYSDNWLTDVMQSEGMKHALCVRSKLDHLQSKTLKSLDKESHDHYTSGQKDNYDKLLGGLE